MDQMSRRQQQPRSNSISGQDFHSNNGYQRLKHSIVAHDGNIFSQPYQSSNIMARLAPTNQTQYHYQIHQQQQPAFRAGSPISLLNSPVSHDQIQRDNYAKTISDKQHKNHMHASLECLNTIYSDYNQSEYQENTLRLLQQQRQQQQQQHYVLQHHQQQRYFQQHPQQHHQPTHQQNYTQNQHYAASYLLATPPANTIVNRDGEHDLAAAAMGSPNSSNQYQSNSPASLSASTTTSTPPNTRSSQPSLVSTTQTQVTNMRTKAMAQASNQNQCLKRTGLLNGIQANNAVGNFPSVNQMRCGYSSLSLASSTFLMEEKLQNEIKKLQSEIKTEKEKNEALNSQLNINSNLMAAFEQSLTTLNTRLRQMTTLNEKKDSEIEQLTKQLAELKSAKLDSDGSKVESFSENQVNSSDNTGQEVISLGNSQTTNDGGEKKLLRIIEDLKKQLIAKDRLLTDTRLEALSAAHQLEQYESKMGREYNIVVNDDDLDEGVMVTNQSPSDSDAITDSAQFSEINSQISKNNSASNRCIADNTTAPFVGSETSSANHLDHNFCGSTSDTIECSEQKRDNYDINNLNYENRNNHYQDNQSSNSSDLHTEEKNINQHDISEVNSSAKIQFNELESSIVLDETKNNLLAIN